MKFKFKDSHQHLTHQYLNSQLHLHLSNCVGHEKAKGLIRQWPATFFITRTVKIENFSRIGFQKHKYLAMKV